MDLAPCCDPLDRDSCSIGCHGGSVCLQTKLLPQAQAFSRTGSLCSSQTLQSCETLDGPAGSSSWRIGPSVATQESHMCESSGFVASPQPVEQQLGCEAGVEAGEDEALQLGHTYSACCEMIRRHKLLEQPIAAQVARLAEGGAIDDGSRMIVVSWMLEVAEEFGLQQETLHAAVALLDRFLSTSQGVPRCVLQLVSVGCMFVASKQLEVHHPSVEQMVAVAAHSFAAGDLLRVERILLDALAFNLTCPTPYAFLHLLTQATIAAESCSGAGTAAPPPPGPPMERVVSLAMYLAELGLLDTGCLAFPGSSLATGALLLAHLTLSRSTAAWPGVLAAAGMSQEALAPVLAALGRLHVAAALPPSAQLGELLAPLQAKFGAPCWCRVSVEVSPLSLQAAAEGALGEPTAMQQQ